MTRQLKTLLLWLLIALLPLHAVAGSFGMSCTSGHQQSQEQAASSVAHHGAVAGSTAHHDGEHAGHGAASPPAADSQDHEKFTHASCSACSAFCVGAVAPPSTDLTVPSFDGSDAVVATPTAFAVGFIQDGPQRPPRH